MKITKYFVRRTGLLEEYAEGEFEELDYDELQTEIEMLDQLIRKANVIRQNENERKFLELEKTLLVQAVYW